MEGLIFGILRYFIFKLRAKRCDRPCNLLPGSPADLSLKHTLSRDLKKETDYGLIIIFLTYKREI